LPEPFGFAVSSWSLSGDLLDDMSRRQTRNMADGGAAGPIEGCNSRTALDAPIAHL
jgi:hypothetical protein